MNIVIDQIHHPYIKILLWLGQLQVLVVVL